MLFLVDTSGSTGVDFTSQTINGPDADIHRINAAVQGHFRNLRYPTSGSDLAAEQDNIDVSLITYNDNLRVEVPWTMATQLDPAITPFTAQDGTRTGAALQYALGYIGHRLRYYITQNIKHGRPTNIHFTDGAPTDMTPGDAMWQAAQSRLFKVNPQNDPEKRFAVIRHMIADNGANPVRALFQLSNGTSATGLDVLSQGADDGSTDGGAESALAVVDRARCASPSITSRGCPVSSPLARAGQWSLTCDAVPPIPTVRATSPSGHLRASPARPRGA